MYQNLRFLHGKDASDHRGPTGYGGGLGVLYIEDEPSELEWPRIRACLLRPKSSAFVGALNVCGAAR